MKTKELLNIATRHNAPSDLSAKVMDRIVQEPKPTIRKNFQLLGVQQRRVIITLGLFLVVLSILVAFNSNSESFALIGEKIGSFDFSGFSSPLSHTSISSTSVLILVLTSVICFLGLDMVLNKRLGGTRL